MAESKIIFDRLNDFNWATWRFRMELMLMREDLWATVKDPKPEGKDVTPAWTRKDEKARSMIGLALEDGQLSHIMDVATANEMWEILKNYHERGSLSNKICVLRRLCSMRLDESGNMSDHLAKASELVHRLTRLKEPLKEQLVVAILLSSLPVSYNPLVTALEGHPEEDLKLEYVKGKLLDEWRRRCENQNQEEVREQVMKSTVFSTDQRRFRMCYRCGKEGHIQCHCPGLLQERNEEVKEHNQGSGSVDSKRGVCFTTMTGRKLPKEGEWIIDTGCTKHMTGVAASVLSRIPWKEKVILADGKTVMARGSGQGRINGRGPEGESVNVRIKEMLYVPGLSVSVLSVSRITDEGYTVVFGSKDCKILDGNTVIAVGEKNGDLYYLKQ